MKQQGIMKRFRLGVVALPAAFLFLMSTAASGDDRGLFQSVNASPYVFMILDISGSMTWQAGSSARTVHGMDDPDARMYQAKRAIYEVLEDPAIGDSLRYGWATFERGANRAELVRKHWLYTPASNPPWYPGLNLFGAGEPIQFGEPRNRLDNFISWRQQFFGNSDGNINIGPGIWQYGECDEFPTDRRWIHDFPKLGNDGDVDTVLYLDDGTGEYRIVFDGLTGGQELGDPEVLVRIRIWSFDDRCRREDNGEGNYNGDWTLLWDEDIRMVPIETNDGLDPAIAFQPFPDAIDNSYGLGYRSFILDDYEVDGTCNGTGWESNFDSDFTDGNPISYDRQNDPLGRGAALARGDVVPWDWEEGVWPTNSREEILFRLAPNLSINEPIPDFRAARYWTNQRNSDGFLTLRPEFAGRPPIMPEGSTPLGQSLNAFGDWYQTWEPLARHPDTGDERLDCRQRNVILITDGEDTCNTQSYVCDAATRLRGTELEPENRVFVVGFTFAGDRSTLDCIADNGGTGALDLDGDGERDGPGPIFVESPAELVERLREIFVQIQSEATTVSAAAVPSVQVDVSDRLFLTEFKPIENTSVWPGRLDAFVAPLPTDADGLPDRDQVCVDLFDSGCLAWEAQDVMVTEQYDAVEPVGNDADQRRIYYSEFREATENSGAPVGPGGAIPAQRRFWQPISMSAPPTPAVRTDLANALGINPAAPDVIDQINDVIETHLTLRTEILPDGSTERYLMGDIFHSDPLLLQAPSNATYLALDLMGDPAVDCEIGDPNSYRCFALLHERRRKVIGVGSNDGMLHFFDAGNFHLDPTPNPANSGRFDNGTGRELFAYMPRVLMPAVKDLTVDQPREHQFTLDGSPIAADVFIDPVHGGVGSTDLPAAAEREWRTVVMGGMRRGGSVSAELIDPAAADPMVPQLASGYYLLDMTQPDLIDALDSYGGDEPDPDSLADTWVPDVSNVNEPPTCLAQADGSSIPSGCGPVPYGAVLWEFNDTLSGVSSDTENIEGLRLDEDDNGWVDLAPTWSIPILGRIQVCTGSACDPRDPDADDDLEDRYVSIFGGGYDPEAPDARGNFIYIVDLETGNTLLKRDVYGSVAARPVAQLSEDGYIERIYFGTTLGLLYRLDLRPEIGTTFDIPVVTSASVVEHSSQHTGSLSVSVERIWEADFEPIILFNANAAPLADVINGVATDIRPIYIEPTMVFVLERNANALLFGTGNRENIFLREEPAGRFFAVVDDISTEDLRNVSFTTLDPSNLVNTTASTNNPDILLDEANRGWWLELAADERLVGRPFAVAGVLFFSTYIPTETVPGAGNVCEERGFSRVYGVFTASSDPILVDDDGNFVRSATVSGLVTKPFAVPYQTQNTPKVGSGDPLTDAQQAVFDELKKLFPDMCRFPPGMRMDINVRSENTGLERVASVPICVIESAFREGG
ncbi:MAG: hypothetical protein MPN21_24055 [Thermoanaerobaculia bacterium]|nr:hypothetical protein [Thermoanaerobaculia bacterium]